MTTPDKKTAYWSDTVSRTLRGFYLFVPAIVITWLMVEVVASQVPGIPELAQAGLLLLCLDFYLAAAARLYDLSSDNVFWLATSRTGSCIEPMLVLFFLSLFSVACIVVVFYQDFVWLQIPAVAVVAVIDLYIVARAWPFWGIPYHFTGKVVWSPAARGGMWSGPGLGLAWRLTGEQGVLNCYSLRFMAALIMLAVIIFILRFTLLWNGVSDVVLYVIGLPLLSVLVMDGSGAMLDKSHIELDEYE